MPPWTDRVYGVPPERVVGSSIKTRFMLRRDIPILLRFPQVHFVDGPGKRPVAAFGNSDGDAAMDDQDPAAPTLAQSSITGAVIGNGFLSSPDGD
jgi:hypothetical protein